MLTRRNFIGHGMLVTGALLWDTCNIGAREKEPPVTKRERKIKLGLIGCGSRGSWITKFFTRHGGYEFHAVADYFPEVADKCGEDLGVDKTRRFSTLSGYKKLIESGVEAVVIEDVPYFYPEQAKAAVEAGCHVYMAKPVAVDVPGCFTIEAASKLATEKKRCFLVDYQLPTQPESIEVFSRIRAGGLGSFVHLVSYGVRNDSVWTDPPKDATAESFMKYFWHSKIALCGDVIVMFDIHIIDAVVWVMGMRPISASPWRSR